MDGFGTAPPNPVTLRPVDDQPGPAVRPDVADLLDRPLLLREALAGGITRGELRSRRWRRPFHGVHVAQSLPDGDVELRIRAASRLLPPDGAVTGWAAAWWLGVTTLDGRDRFGGSLDVPLVIPTHRQLTRRPGIAVTRATLPATESAVVRGVPVTVALRTCFDQLRNGQLVDAVVALDAMLHAGAVDLTQMWPYVAAHRGWRGIEQARAAIGLADARAESPTETRLRLIWVGGGLPCPECNAWIYDDQGRFLARTDLLDVEAAVAVEYDGEVHRAAKRHAADLRRERRLSAAGIIVARFTGPDVFDHPERALADMISFRERGLARDRSRDRWRWSRDPLHVTYGWEALRPDAWSVPGFAPWEHQ